MGTRASNGFREWLRGFKDALPIVIVLVGGWAALRVAPVVAEPGGILNVSPAPVASQWASSLLGKHIHLPAADLNGRPVPRRAGTLVLSVSCTDCASPDALLTTIVSAPVKPVVLVSTEFTEPYRRVMNGAEDVRMVQLSPDSTSVPSELLLRAPQAVVLDERGVVVAVLRQHETLKMFFDRMGGKR